ncbi:hypothetical protein [Chromobacterium violaceum]|uniref:hypothetical protein n=1 Tax=Chromobacterium violaceum TaxID=536 RepID=UPI001056D6A5|nr:hypothetical protein [Chromobacterium violaceum]
MKSIIFLLLALLSITAKADDVDDIIHLAKAVQDSGLTSDYKMDAYELNLFTTTNSVDEAKSIAFSACKVARQKFHLKAGWKIRAFLITGDRPAAVCYTRKNNSIGM